MAQVKFPLNGDLINHGFDGYKLRLFGDNENPIETFDLLSGAHSLESESSSSSSTPFKLLSSRATLNRIFPDVYLSNHFYYFSAENQLVTVALQEPGKVHQHAILTLSQQNQPNTETSPQLEPPSLAFAAPDLMVVSDGQGKVSLVEIPPNRSQGKVLFEFDHREFDSSGYVVMSAVRSQKAPREVRCLVYCAKEGAANDPMDSGFDGVSAKSKLAASAQSTHIHFQVKLLSFLQGQDDEGHFTVRVLANCQSPEHPRVGFVEDDGLGFVLGGAEFTGLPLSLRKPTAESPAPGDQPARAPKPKATYSWTQTSQDLTVTVPLPANVQKSNIRCLLTSKTVRLFQVSPEATFFEGTLFDKINYQESVWTLEDAKEGRAIAFHLEKQNVLRWTQVFQEEDGVLEAHDPSALAEIQERMEKYTEESPSPFQNKLTSLQGNEECDELGDTFVVTRFDETGVQTHRSHTSYEWLSTSAAAGSFSKKKYRRVQLGLKMDLDCLFFEVRAGLEASHTGVMSAFGYIQASKRQRKFLTFTDNLQFAVIVEASRHVYLYRQPAAEKGKNADQYLYDLSTHEEILGVCQLNHRQLAALTGTQVFLLTLPS